jgi:phosphoserine phosphatase
MDEGVLPSWNDGSIRTAIVDFVTKVTKQGSADFVPPPERIAVFDNDGTLWAEWPLFVQIYFALDRLGELANADPSMRDKQPYKAFLEHDLKTIANFSRKDALLPAMATHAGVTEEDFAVTVDRWFASAKHPKLGRAFTDCAYRPQRELLDYLRANGFKTFIVTGGGVDFVRRIAGQLYGVPPEQVVGSSLKAHFETFGGTVTVRKLAEIGSFDDREEKVVNIVLHIGRRPIFAFGNSDGDLAMLRYTLAGEGARLGMLLHHDDAEREFAYDRAFRVSPLGEALDQAAALGIQVVGMKENWKTIF